MAKIERVDRGIYRVTNKDGSISWMIDYLNPDKKRIRKTFSTKKEAVAERAKRVSLINEGEYRTFVEIKKPYTATFGDLLKMYKEKHQDDPHYKKTEKSFFDRFIKHFKDETILSSIEYVDLENFRDNLKKTLGRNNRPLSKSTINSYMSCLSKMFKMAKRNKLIGKNPFHGEDSLRFNKLNNKRQRFLTREEAKRLFNASPIHLQHIIECALYTGMRKGNILGLKWNQIRDGWIYLECENDAKTGQELIPVSNAMQDLLDRIKASGESNTEKKINVLDMKGKPVERKKEKSEYVFLYKGKPIDDCKTALIKACKDSNIPYGRYTPSGITFHDLRHSFGSLLAETGVHIKTMQDLMTHSDIKMTERYTHMGDETKRQAVNGLDWNLR